MTREVLVAGRPEADEAAAILAAIAVYLGDEDEPEPRVIVSAWALAGRREAQGLSAGRTVIRAGWSR